jgi:predicted ester cyclase
MFKHFVSLILLLTISSFVYGQEMNMGPMEAKYKHIYAAVLKILDNGNVDELDNYVAKNTIEHDTDYTITTKTGLEGVKDIFRYYHNIFPDMKTTINFVAVSGDTLLGYISQTGTTSQPFMGMPAGQKMTMNMVDMIVFKDGKMIEHRGFTANTDLMEMMPHENIMKKE